MLILSKLEPIRKILLTLNRNYELHTQQYQIIKKGDGWMQFKEWIEAHNQQQLDVAKTLGVSRALLSEIARGKRRATPGLAKKIEAYTNGEVNRFELIYPGESFTALKRGTPLSHEVRNKILDECQSVSLEELRQKMAK